MTPPLPPAGSAQTDGERLVLSPLLDELRPLLAAAPHPVYLVGGAVRDAILGRASDDLDFAVATGAIQLAFNVANARGWPAYKLDRERDIGRVMAGDVALDFARFRGPTLADDLRARDFTVNALALPVEGKTTADVIDPTGGRSDLAAGRLRLTSPLALESDPVRAIRAIRFAEQLSLAMTDDTRVAIARAAPALLSVSPERLRDEFNKLLLTEPTGQALRTAAETGLLTALFPALAPIATEAGLQHVVAILDALTTLERDVLWAAPLARHLERPVDGNVNGRLLLRLAALWHDAAAPGEAASAVRAALAHYRYSNQVRRHVTAVVQGQTRVSALSADVAAGGSAARRAIYRFFRDLGRAGVDVALLAAAHGQPAEVAIVQRLLRDYWERHDTRVAPPLLADGRAVMQWLGLKPGPQIGRILEALREAQAVGEVRTRGEAEKFVRAF